MIILLTGSKGFTGIHFKRMAEWQGHKVVDFDADITDSVAVANGLASVEFSHVVHLAAVSFVAHANVEEIYRVNLLGTLNLLEGLVSRGLPIERVLLASSANVYGNASEPELDENTSPAPVNHYAASKLAMESMANVYLNSLPIILARPFNYTGPGQNPDFIIPKLVEHFLAKASFIELGNLAVEREFNDVRMVCQAYLKLLTLGKRGQIYNVCSGQGTSLLDVLKDLTALTGHQPEIHLNPKYLRQNEVQRLVGNPSRLISAVGPLPVLPITATLKWMLTGIENDG